MGKIKNAVNYLVWRYLPSCKEVTVLMSRSRENDLSFREKAVMKAHLYTCIACHRYLKQLDFMGEVFEIQDKKIEQGERAPTLSPEAMERLKNAVKSAKL